MGRKPLPKIKLTDEEANVCSKVASMLKVGWFSIAGTIYDTEGKVLYPSRSEEYDEVYDLEAKRYVSLQYGVKLLNEAFEADEANNSIMLKPKNLFIWKKLLTRLNLI